MAGLYDPYMPQPENIYDRQPSGDGGADGFGGRLYQAIQQSPAVWTTLASSLLAGPEPSAEKVGPAKALMGGFKRFAANAPIAYAADARTAKDRQAAADKNARINAIMGYPGLSPEDRAFYMANPDKFDPMKLRDAMGGGADEYYGSAQWYQMPDGSLGFGVLSKTGDFKAINPPEGSQWAPKVTYQDAGTSRVPTYSQGGGVAGAPIQVDVEGEKAAQESGSARGRAAANLPVVEAASDRMVRTIDDVLSDPYLPSMTGPFEGRLPNVTGQAARVQSKIDQLMGGTFLQAYNDLRGGGQITEAEGSKATAAYNRLATMTVDDAEYVKALKEFRAELLKLTAIARQRAGQADAAPQASAPVVNPQEQPVPEGVDPNDWKYMTPEERALWN